MAYSQNVRDGVFYNTLFIEIPKVLNEQLTEYCKVNGRTKKYIITLAITNFLATSTVKNGGGND